MPSRRIGHGRPLIRCWLLASSLEPAGVRKLGGVIAALPDSEINAAAGLYVTVFVDELQLSQLSCEELYGSEMTFRVRHIAF